MPSATTVYPSSQNKPYLSGLFFSERIKMHKMQKLWPRIQIYFIFLINKSDSLSVLNYSTVIKTNECEKDFKWQCNINVLLQLTK